MTELAGRVALVTGASSGIGAALARALADADVRLGLASRRGDDLGLPDVVAEPCDVRRLDELERIVGATVDRFGSLDILVANAGVGAYGAFLDLERETLDEMVDVNVRGLLYSVRAALGHLLRSDEGQLLTIASVAGQHGPEGEAVYSASKFAQVGFMRAIDHELWSEGVRCSTLCPGGVATEFAMGRGRTRDMPDLDDMMSAEEVADVALLMLQRPRSQRILEATLLPMHEDSMG